MEGGREGGRESGQAMSVIFNFEARNTRLATIRCH